MDKYDSMTVEELDEIIKKDSTNYDARSARIAKLLKKELPEGIGFVFADEGGMREYMMSYYESMPTKELEDVVKNDRTDMCAWNVLIQRRAKELGASVDRGMVFDPKHIQENLEEKEDW